MASVRRTKSGIEIRAYAGRDALTGSVRNLYKSLPLTATEEEIASVSAELQATADALRGTGVPFTLRGLLTFYLDSLAVDHSPTYVDSCRSNAECYLYPEFGARRVDTIRPYEFMRLYQRLMASGGKDGHPVSPNTVRKLHAWLSPAFDQLVAMGAIPENPLAGVKRPSPAQTGAKALAPEDLAKLADYLRSSFVKRDTPEYALDLAIFLDLSTGLRAGELAGLNVDDFDPASSQLFVRRSVARSVTDGLVVKSTKSGHSRALSLSQKVCRYIGAYLALRPCPSAPGGGMGDPLFPSKDGSYRDPRDFSRHFRHICQQLEIGNYAHLHTLRHTHATYLLRKGVPMRTVQERLGHSSISTTLGIYGHVLEGDDKQAADAFDSVMEGLA